MVLVHQGSRFVLVGAIQVALDGTVFVALSALGVTLIGANLTGRIAGACLGFWLNGRLTFATPGKVRLGARRFLRFLLSWLLFTSLSTLLLSLVATELSLAWAWLAKPMVEAGMAVLSFFVARHWIYR